MIEVCPVSGKKTTTAAGKVGLVAAAIPTLLVFIFCQNIILRGIVIPTFK